jgi:hypothetical protein
MNDPAYFAPSERSFVPGLRLSEALYVEGIEPVLAEHMPGLIYAVARLDSGSDVLGYDTPTSMDHGWGPRATVFLEEEDIALADQVAGLLAERLPVEVHGIPTNFESPRLFDGGLRRIDHPPLQHGVSCTTIGRFFTEHVGFDPRNEIRVEDWLTTPSQRLRTIASGRVFRDPGGRLETIRTRLQWYPRELWMYLMASQWHRIGQEEAFMARAGQLGDELGSRGIASRLVWDLMRLAFLQERAHMPYSKWTARAFAELPIAASLGPALETVLRSETWEAREGALSDAYVITAERHNALRVTPPLDSTVHPFFERPIQVIGADRFAEALEAEIGDARIEALPRGVGAVWQFADSTDVLDEISVCRRLEAVYRPDNPISDASK